LTTQISLPTTTETKGTYAFVSLGCPKNLVDSERMLGLLQLDGYRLVQDPIGSDFVIINTCGFIEDARNESLATIDEMIALKKDAKTRGIIVSGCLAEHQKDRLLEIRPEIDALVGVFGREEITRVADRFVGNLDEQRTIFEPAPIRALADTDRLRITPRHFAYLKISEGCDRLCTFCGIPQMRGKHATKPIETVLEEARQLAADGVREIIIVAQDTTYYGMDLYGEPRLRELLEQLAEVEGIDWIRLMYLYPQYLDDPLLDTIASTSNILPYIDLPLQHINDRMLKRMARQVTRQEVEELLARMRSRVPGLTIRTTMITGFPGETDAEFSELHDFVKEQEFERLGVFTYSFEPNTPSANLPNHVEEEVKNNRRDLIMASQQEIMLKHNSARIGDSIPVILDSRIRDEQNVWVGRSMADAPEVDSLVYVTGNDVALTSGRIATVEVVAAQDYDLIGIATGAVH
jgi:ribosomal protein S12 methylthiotransferase